jgi:hypothetical protein
MEKHTIHTTYKTQKTPTHTGVPNRAQSTNTTTLPKTPTASTPHTF